MGNGTLLTGTGKRTTCSMRLFFHHLKGEKNNGDLDVGDWMWLVKCSLGANKTIPEIGVILIDISKSQINRNLNQNNLGSNHQKGIKHKKQSTIIKVNSTPSKKPDLNPHSKPLRAKRKCANDFPVYKLFSHSNASLPEDTS